MTATADSDRLDVLLAALNFAERMCGCESYYHYTCGKCRAIGQGETPPGLAAAVRMGLVTWEGYGAPNLTEAGRVLRTRLQVKGDES